MSPELPSTAMGALRLMPASVTQISQFSNQLIEGVKDGNIHPLELLVLLRALERVSKTVIENVKENINTAADKYSEKEIELFGAKIEKAEVGVSYDYRSSGDPEWERWSVDEHTAADNRKEREKFLRALREPIEVLHRDTGELVTIRPPLRRSESGLKVYLK